VIDNVVWTDSCLSIAGAGCGLTGVGAGEEQARKVVASEASRVASPPSFSFTVDDLAAEKGDDASSSQALSEENQAKLREILSLLQRDIQDQVRDVDLLEKVLECINQELPDDIKASLEPISQLDNHFAAVRRALKNQSSRPVLEQKRSKAKQFVKES
jgi:hypothetical protein